MESRAHDAAASRLRSREAELLLAAASLHPDPTDVRRASAAMSPPTAIAWNTFIPTAYRHGVLPLLYRHLSTGIFDATLVPVPALSQMRREVERSAQRSLMLAGKLVWLLGELEQRGIRVVPLKGPILAQQLYGSVALRRINDLDLLVAEEDAERAVALIERLGHHAESSWSSASLNAAHRAALHHVGLTAAAAPYRVELHYCLHLPLGRQRYTLATLATELESFSFLGSSVRVMRPEALLVYLCIHGTKHRWERIEWVGGLAQLLRGTRALDWDRITESARRIRGERALRSGLHVVHALFDVPIPPAELRGDRAARTAARVIVDLLATNRTTIASPTALLIHQLRTETGLEQRAWRVWWTLFAPTIGDRQAVPLPRVLSPLYYVLRPARLLARRVHLRAWWSRRRLART